MAKKEMTAGELIDSGAWSVSQDISFPYLNGNSYSCYCRYVLNYGPFRENPNGNPDWCFIKTDFVGDFFAKHMPKRNNLVIITHNSDYPITEAYKRFLDDPRVKVWFAQNADYDHPKLKALALGVGNGGYPHGDISVFNSVRSRECSKTNMFYVNFTVGNNPNERNYCLSQTGLSITPTVQNGWRFLKEYVVPNTFEGYLADMAKSYFTISPRGNGIDCHRTWEALYVKSIPVVTKSIVAQHHKDLPIIILDDWADFKKIDFSPALYEKVWNNFNTGDIHMDNYLKRMQKVINET